MGVINERQHATFRIVIEKFIVEIMLFYSILLDKVVNSSSPGCDGTLNFGSKLYDGLQFQFLSVLAKNPASKCTITVAQLLPNRKQ